MNTANIGIASGMLGAGRTTKDSPIDFGAGILWKKKVGDAVQKGETIATLYSEKQDFLNDTKTYLQNNYTIANEKPAPRKLIHKRVVSEKVLSNNL
jgi:pyrimidine-nucleoside phosphorylase